MKKSLLLILSLVCFMAFSQQKFVPDATGRVLNADFKYL